MTDFLYRGEKRKKTRKRVEIEEDVFSGDLIPSEIVINFNNNIEIQKIDESIKHRYKLLNEQCKNIESSISEINEKLKTDLTNIEKLELQNNLFLLEKDLDDYKNNKSIKEYEKRSSKIIRDYMDIPFGEISKRKNIIIDKYLGIASEYIKIEVIRNVDIEYKCKGCGASMENLTEEIEGSFTCDLCNTLNTYLTLNTKTKDLDRITCGDDETLNFIKVLDKFEGKHFPCPPEEIYNKLDNYFELTGFPKGEEIKKLELLPNGKKKGTSKSMLWNALENIGYNNHYEECNYIAYRYWGWKLPDISKYRDQIIEEYQKTQKVWQKISKNYNRKASLGTQYRLYVQLKSVGYPVEKEDFRIQESMDSLRLHNEAWKKMCDEVGIKCFIVD